MNTKFSQERDFSSHARKAENFYIGNGGFVLTDKDQKRLSRYIDSYYSSYFQMDAIYNEWASHHKIQDTTLFVLNEISKHEYCTQRSLHACLGYSKQTLSSSLRRLEQEGIIIRQRTVHDQRSNLIRLTPKGKIYADRLLSRLHKAEIRAFQLLSPDECEQVLSAFHKLTDALANSIRADMEAPAAD